MPFAVFNIASKRSVLHCHLLAWHMHRSVLASDCYPCLVIYTGNCSTADVENVAA